jgi:hypothetical protein
MADAGALPAGLFCWDFCWFDDWDSFDIGACLLGLRLDLASRGG